MAVLWLWWLQTLAAFAWDLVFMNRERPAGVNLLSTYEAET